MPTIEQLRRLLMVLKKDIDDDCRTPDFDIPHLEVTVACNDDGTEWSYQTGDRASFGPCWRHPHWHTVALCRKSDTKALSRDIVSQLRELMPDSPVIL